MQSCHYSCGVPDMKCGKQTRTWFSGMPRLCRKYPAEVLWNRHLLRKIQETLYIGQWYLHPLQSKHLGTSYSSPNCHQLPSHIFLNLIDGLKSLPFQRWLWFWEKLEVVGCQTWPVGELSNLGDLMFCQKTLHEIWYMSGCIVAMKLPITSCP